uniref:Uncharacterized protein n=1 Tax=Romanomermis culicivorax TaxID=13658 RepID=A0A915IYZ8_ROMCU
MMQLNFNCSDNVNKSWNGMLYSSDTDLFVSSEDNKPATISNIVWQMGSDAEYDCHDSSPLEIQGTIQ